MLLKFNKLIPGCFTLLIFLSSISIKAQVVDTFTYGELRIDHPFENSTYQVENIHDSYLFMNHQWDTNLQTYRFSLIITDTDFNKISSIDTLATYTEYGGVYIAVINEAENSLVLDKVEYIDDRFVYSTYLLDLSTFEINPVDSIIMPEGEMIDYHTPIIAAHNDSYTRFAKIKESQGARVYANCFIEISTDGMIDIQYIDMPEPMKGPAQHIYIDELNSYFIPDNTNDFVLLDDEFQFQYKIPGEVIYKLGDTTFYATLYSCFCRFQKDKIHVLGRTFFSTSNYAFLHATLPVIEEKIEASDQTWPLFDVDNFKGRTQATYCREDSEGNIIAVTDDHFNFGPVLIAENLYVQKVNKNYENDWFVGFNNGSEFDLKDLVIDKNNDVIIVGRHWRKDFLPEVHNFYLKISTKGLISASHGVLPPGMFVLYPNPTNENVSIDGPTESINTYAIYDMQGRMLRLVPFNDGSKIILDDLQAGTYFIHSLNKKGELVNASKVIKY